jgi:hypothetical protein
VAFPLDTDEQSNAQGDEVSSDGGIPEGVQKRSMRRRSVGNIPALPRYFRTPMVTR